MDGPVSISTVFNATLAAVLGVLCLASIVEAWALLRPAGERTDLRLAALAWTILPLVLVVALVALVGTVDV